MGVTLLDPHGLGWLGLVLFALSALFLLLWALAQGTAHGSRPALRIRISEENFSEFKGKAKLGEIKVELFNRRLRRPLDVTGFKLTDPSESRFVRQSDPEVTAEVGRLRAQHGSRGGLIGPRERAYWWMVDAFPTGVGRPGYEIVVEDADAQRYTFVQVARPVRAYMRF